MMVLQNKVRTLQSNLEAQETKLRTQETKLRTREAELNTHLLSHDKTLQSPDSHILNKAAVGKPADMAVVAEELPPPMVDSKVRLTRCKN